MRKALLCVVAAIAAIAAVLALAAPALAHPHVWVTIRSQIVYAPDGRATAVRHAWTFDDMFSAFATQGLPQQTKGQFTREELAPLAEVNVTSLKEYGYFTFAKAGGRTVAFLDPRDYWLDYRDAMLTLHFVLPLREPAAGKRLELQVYDESYFVAFELAPQQPVALDGAPAGCSTAVRGPQEMSTEQAQRLSQLDAATPNLVDKLDDSFANTITVTCP
jgi:ABC-type uncharacterized transport system substrate-binding protein